MARVARARYALALLLLLCAGGASAHGGKKYGGVGGKKGRGKKGAASSRRGACKGTSCAVMSALLPSLAFAEGAGPVVDCSCQDYAAGRCFAPGCFPCENSCFDGVPDGARLAKMGGPFGTGLLCSSDCLPCCQAPDDEELFEGSACALPEGGCAAA
jgi:hypothetical protein